MQCAVCSVQGDMGFVHFEVCSLQRAVCSLQRAVCSGQMHFMKIFHKNNNRTRKPQYFVNGKQGEGGIQNLDSDSEASLLVL